MITRLFTTYYSEKNPERAREYIECLKANSSCNAITSIHILDETITQEFKDAKVHRRPISKRPTYTDFFDWANELSNDGDYTIIANTDIAFDESIRILTKFSIDNHLCLALSRWDVLANNKLKLFEHGDSQDVWIFKGKIQNVRGEFPLGVFDCDNKIAWELEQAGYRVINPCYAVRTYHHHQCGFRSYEVTPPPDYGIRPPFRYVEPDNYWGPLKAWRIKREHHLSYLPWMMTRQRFWRYPLPKLATRVWSKVTKSLRLTDGHTQLQAPKSS